MSNGKGEGKHLPGIRTLKAVVKRDPDLAAVAHSFGVSYARLWYRLHKAGETLPYRRAFRRGAFIEAMRRYPKSPAMQADFVGLTPRQFRASCRRYGLVDTTGKPSRENA